MPEVRHGAAGRGGVPFFARAKKGTKETRPRRHALRFAPGPRAGREFSYGTSLCHTKTPSSMTAPFGFYPAHSPRLMGTRRQHQQQRRAPIRQAPLLGPLGPAVTGGKTPQGRRTGRAPFSAGAGCPVRKFPPGLRTRRAAAGGPPGGVSFAYFSLHKQRKVGPPRRAAPCLNLVNGFDEKTSCAQRS